MQLISEAQGCGFELVETILSVCMFHDKQFCRIEPVAELSKRILFVQKDLGLQCVTKVSAVMLSLFVILIELELEHEQLSVLKLFHFLLNWKYGDGICIITFLSFYYFLFSFTLFDILYFTNVIWFSEYVVGGTAYVLHEELLLIFPVISLLSSTSKSVKGAATDILIILEKLLVEVFVAPKAKPTKEEGFPSLSTQGSIVFRLFQHQWFQVLSLSLVFCVHY